MNNPNNLNTKSESFEFNSEFDFNTIFKILLRGKRFIFTITSIISLLSIVYAYRIPREWKGEFDIVIQSDSAGKNDILKNLPGLPKRLLEDDNEFTQELILKSRSVLNPIFKYVKNYYSKNNIKKKQNINFDSWLGQELKIQFKEKSKVLNVSYQNQDKTLIINVLNKLAVNYKNYSKTQNDKKIDITLDYLMKLQKTLKTKSESSTLKYNKFTIENRIGSLDGFVELGEDALNLQLPSNIGAQLKVDTFRTDRSVPKAGQRYNSQFLALERLESEYISLSSKLKPNTKYLKTLNERIDTLRNSLKRPNEILLEYRKLYLDSKRDNELYNNVEDNIQSLKLKKYEEITPWEIIAKPLIGEFPVYPVKRVILLQAFLTSFLLASIFTILKERLSGKIYEIELMKDYLDINFLDTLYPSKAYFTLEVVRRLLKERSINEDESLGILNYTSLPFDQLMSVLDPKELISKYEIDLNSKNLNLNDDPFLLVNESGEITKKSIILINKFKRAHSSQFMGWLFLDKKTNLI